MTGRLTESPDAPAPRMVAASVRPRRPAYPVMLALVVASFTFATAAPEDVWASFVLVVMQAALVVVAARTADVRPAVRAWCVRLAVAGVVLSALAVFTASSGRLASAGLSALLATIVPVLVVRGLVGELRTHGATMHAVFAALTLYVLLGLVFAFVFSVLAIAGDGGFFEGVAENSRADSMFFSYTTLTTTGYGNLVPVGDTGRAFAVLEAILGQIYLVTVVALLVSNLGRSTLRRED